MFINMYICEQTPDPEADRSRSIPAALVAAADGATVFVRRGNHTWNGPLRAAYDGDYQVGCYRTQYSNVVRNAGRILTSGSGFSADTERESEKETSLLTTDWSESTSSS